MPKNPRLFPDNFLLDGSNSESGIGALEVAVNNLSVAAKFGAMRQANAIRIGGLGSIKNQNRGMPTLNSLLPTRSVGKYVTPPSEPSGTVGYFVGGLSTIPSLKAEARIDRFTFAASTNVSIGDASAAPQYAFAFANKNFGYLALNALFFRLTFQSEVFSSIGAVLFPQRYIGASLRTASRGYACGGVQLGGSGTVYPNTDRFSFAGEVCVSISTAVQARNYSFGFGNKFNGYVGGGLNTGVSTAVTSNIERFSYANETVANISSMLSAGGKSNAGFWTPGSSFAAYLISGNSYGRFPDPVNSAFRLYVNNKIEKFTYSGETMSVLGVTLSNGISGFSAVGNQTRVVVGGGSKPNDAYSTQNAGAAETNQLIGFTFTTESLEVLSATLSKARTGLNAVDNSTF